MNLYVFTFLCAALLTWGSLPVFKRILGPLLTDKPGGLKKHTRAVPMIGGCAIFFSFAISLMLLRLVTHFPTATLHSLRGILSGATLIFALGLADDLRKPRGLPVGWRLAVQAAAAGLLIYYGTFVQIFANGWLNYALTFLWIVGLTNAFNLLDIKDGLCISQAVVCTVGLFAISLPGECGYVNFAAMALLGACLAFWPFNHLPKKVFLGDSGSTFIGFLIAALSMGTQYSHTNPYGYTAAVFMVAAPLLDTSFVTLARLLQHKNPLKGSDDHLALCLTRRWHLTERTVLILFVLAAVASNILAYLVTQMDATHTQAFCVLCAGGAGMILVWLLQKLHTSAH